MADTSIFSLKRRFETEGVSAELLTPERLDDITAAFNELKDMDVAVSIKEKVVEPALNSMVAFLKTLSPQGKVMA